MKYTVYIFDGIDNTEQFIGSEAEAEKYADELAADYPEFNVFIAFGDGYLNRDGHSPVGKKW